MSKRQRHKQKDIQRKAAGFSGTPINKKKRRFVQWRELWHNDPLLHKMYGEELESIVSSKESLEEDFSTIDDIKLQNFLPRPVLELFNPHSEVEDADYEDMSDGYGYSPNNKRIFDGPPWKGSADM